MDVDALLKSPVTSRNLARLSPTTDGENSELSRLNGLNGHALRSESPPPSRKPSSTRTSIPAKRKQHPSPPPANPSRSTPLAPAHRHNPASSDVDPEAIRCICSIPTDDGWSIGCDGCTRWLHGVCVGFPKQERLKLPEKWLCWSCDPSEIQRSLSRLGVDMDSVGSLASTELLKLWRERARTIQMNRVRLALPHDETRKPRRISTNTTSVDDHHGGPQNKRKRHVGASPMTPASSTGHGYFPFHPSFPAFPSTATPPLNLDDSLNETHDVVLDGEVKERLGRLAKEYAYNAANATGTTTPDWMKGAGEWRGVSAISAPARKRRKKENPHWEPVVYFGNTLPKKSRVSLKPHHPFPTPTLPVPSLPPPSSSSSYPAPLPPPPPPLPSPLPSLSSANLNGHHPPSQFEQQQLLPPTYTLHTSHAVPSTSYLLPYPSLITSSASYLSDPLNGYSKMGMPKSGVKLVGGQWNVALDPKGVQEGQHSTLSSDKDGANGRKEGSTSKAWAKWARNGCRPNAVVRPVVVVQPKKKNAKGNGKEKGNNGRSRTSSPRPSRPVSGVQETTASVSPTPPTPPSPPPPPPQSSTSSSSSSSSSPPPTPKVSFALFALRDLKANEEIVLDWEWDDACVVHLLPKIGEMGRNKSDGEVQEGEEGEQDDDDDQGYDLKHLRLQYAGILRALGDTFTSCACEDHLRTDIDATTDVDAGNAENREGSPRDTNGVNPRKERRGRRKEECVMRRMREFVEHGRFQEDKVPEDEVLTVEVEEGVVDEDVDIDVVGDSPAKDRSSAANGDVVMAMPMQPEVTVDLGPLIGRPRFFRTKEIQKDGRDGFGVGGVEMDDDEEDDIPLGPKIQPPEDDNDDPPTAYHHHPFSYPTPPGFFHPPPTPTTPGLFSPQYVYPIHTYPYGYPPPYWVPPSAEDVSSNRSAKRKESSSSSKGLLWGEAPPQPPPTRSKRDVEDSEADGKTSRQHPQRHQRKRTDQRKVASALSDLEELQVGDAVEEEMPPKMKRRLNLAHGSQGKETSMTLGKKKGRISAELKEEVAKSPVNRPRSRMSISELTEGGGHIPSNMTEQAQRRPIHSTSVSHSPTLISSARKPTLPTSPILSRHQPMSAPPPISETATGRMRSASSVSIPQNGTSSPSPLLSLANLSLLSPAASSITSSTLYQSHRAHGSTNLDSSRQVRIEEREERSKMAQREAQKVLQLHPELRRRDGYARDVENTRTRVATDPLAALAAAAAAARPISPLPARSRERAREVEQREPGVVWDGVSRSSFSGSSSPRMSPRAGLHVSHSPVVNPRSPPSRSSPRESRLTHSSFAPLASPRIDQNFQLMQDNAPLIFYRSPNDPYDNESESSTRVPERVPSHEPNSALLGPGGISLLSSPEHAWVPLRRGNVFAELERTPGVMSSPGIVAEEAYHHPDGQPAPIAIVNAPDIQVDTKSLRIKREILGMDIDHDGSSLTQNDSGAAEEMVVDLAASHSEIRHDSSPIPSSHGDSASPPIRPIPQPLSPADSYIAPLSPPKENFGEIPPWPKSPSPWESESTPSKDIHSPVLNDAEPVEESTPSSAPRSVHGDDVMKERASPYHQPDSESNIRPSSYPTNSAPSSIRSSPAVDIVANAVSLQVVSESPSRTSSRMPSPLSSPLSTPVKNLISLPPHSVPAEDNAQMESNSNQPSRSRPGSPNTLDVPPLEHSQSESMSPRSPGRMSPTTPLNEVIEEPTSSMDIENTGVEVKRSHPGSSILASPVISPENRHRVNGTVDDISASAPPKSYEEDSLMSEVAATPTEVPAPPPTKVKLSLKDFAERKRRERQEKEKAEREERERVKDEERAREAGQKEETESAQSSGRHESFAELPLEVKKEFLEDSTPLPLTDAVSVAAPIAASSTDAVVSPLIETTLSSPTSPIPVNDLETRILQEHPRTDDDVILKASETRNKLISSLPSGPSVTPSSLIFPAVSSYLTPHSPEIEASLDGNAADDVGADNPEDGEIQDGEGGNKTGEDRTNHFTSSPYRAPSPPHLTPSTTLPPSLPAKPSPSYNGLPPKTAMMTATAMKSSTASGAKTSYSPPPPPRSSKFTETTATTNVQRSRTPPTQPRSFKIARRSPSVSSSLHGSPPMRKMSLGSAPAVPSSSSSALVNVAGSSSGSAHGPAATQTPTQSTTPSSAVNPALGKTPPSGPRALRQLQQQQQQNGGGGLMARGNAPYHVPRGFPPYGDRYRDRDRDRDRDRGKDGHWNSRGIRARDGNSGWSGSP